MTCVICKRFPCLCDTPFARVEVPAQAAYPAFEPPAKDKDFETVATESLELLVEGVRLLKLSVSNLVDEVKDMKEEIECLKQKQSR